MRISDWSSDVCSSDLPVGGRRCGSSCVHPRTSGKAAGHRGRAGPHSLWRLGKGRERGRVTCNRGCRRGAGRRCEPDRRAVRSDHRSSGCLARPNGLETAQTKDRKGVGEGKSASVRVVPGGRRSHKKKKKKNK